MSRSEYIQKGQDKEMLFSIAEMDSQTPSCDLHGMYPDEAVERCDKFIDEEFVKGTDVVRIIHGRGSGKLRRDIHELLKNHELVKHFRDSKNPSEAMGATIAILEERH